MMRHFAANALTFLILALVLIFGLVVWGQNTFRGPGPLTQPRQDDPEDRQEQSRETEPEATEILRVA